MSSALNEEFFNEQTERSKIKAEIVAKYLYIWAKIIIPKTVAHRGKKAFAAFIDLYAGQGRYEGGQESTPLLILQRAIREEEFRNHLWLVFNEKEPDKLEKLRQEVTSYPGVDTLAYPPFFLNQAIGNNQVERLFSKPNRPPMLVFADPWGYTGLSIDLFAKVLRLWGCEVMFYFNYQRINAALSNPVLKKNMSLLFGEERAEILRDRLANAPAKKKLRSAYREEVIVGGVKEALQELLKPQEVYTLDYTFKDPVHGSRTTHHLIFATTSRFALRLMKDVMANATINPYEEGGFLGYKPVEPSMQQGLFGRRESLLQLGEILCRHFRGRTLTVGDVLFEAIDLTKFTEGDCKEALKILECSSRVVMDPPIEMRPKRAGEATLANHVRISFVNLNGKAHSLSPND